MGKLRHPNNINKPLQEAAREKNAKYLADYANELSARRLQHLRPYRRVYDSEFLRLLFYHSHRESEEFFKLPGHLAQPNQDSVFSKRPAFFDSLKNKVGHIMAKASAL